jgi:hypothetical protein
VRRTDLIVPVGANQQQVFDFGVRNEMLEEVKRCRIQPLQIIEEQCERVLLASERSEEAPENHLEAVVRILRREVGNGLLFTDNEFDLGDKVDDELAVRAYRVPQRSPPLLHLRFVLCEDLTDEGLEGLRQGRVRDVAFVLVELAGREQATPRDQRPMKLVDHGRFADAGITGHEHEFCFAVVRDAIKGCKEGIDLALPTVQLLGDQQPARRLVRAQRKLVDAIMGLPFHQAPLKIGFEARGGLVALFGGLGEELHNDSREHPGDARDPFARWLRSPSDVAVHPLHRVRRGKRQSTREHLVECDAEGVEVATGVDRTVHSSGLFRCHIGERARDRFRWGRDLALTLKT